MFISLESTVESACVYVHDVHTCDIKVNSSLRSQLSLTLNIIMMLRKGVEGRNINSVHSLCV